jgi:hypothetical protein
MQYSIPLAVAAPFPFKPFKINRPSEKAKTRREIFGKSVLRSRFKDAPGSFHQSILNSQ